MSHHLPERDPRSPLEDEGIPDLQSGAPEQQWAVDPQEEPVPGDQPVAVDDFGTTPQEQYEGESLDGRLAREQPDLLDNRPGDGEPEGDGDRPASVADVLDDLDSRAPATERVLDDFDEAPADTGPGIGQAPVAAGTQDADRPLSEDGGLGPGSDLSTDFEAGPGLAPRWQAQPEEPSGRVWDEPRPAGRLVAPDEGTHSDTEPDEIASEVGPDGGGYSAEESAMRVEPE